METVGPPANALIFMLSETGRLRQDQEEKGRQMERGIGGGSEM